LLDVKKELQAALETVLPTYYELFCDSSTSTPCITWREKDNADYLTGDTLEYSNVGFYIKIWGHSIDDLTDYALSVDNKMKDLGYRRSSSNSIIVDCQIQIVMTYTGLGKEFIGD